MISVEQWQPADGLILDSNSKKVVIEREKCLALTAGPGAGKTEILAQRADFLFRTGTCRYPKRILAISFKVDASTNLKERVQRRCGYELSSRFDSYTFHSFAKQIIDQFRIVLTGNDALDINYVIGKEHITGKQIRFEDLIPLAIKILNKSKIVRNAIHQTYSDVFLDEFQDCTDDQYELIKLAFQRTKTRLIAVGDTKQKIMEWAGALDGIFNTFSQDFSATPLNISRNFRSKSNLLKLQNRIIKNLDPTNIIPDIWINKDNEGEIICHEFQNSEEEAIKLVELIVKWISDEKVPLSEIAILVPKQVELYTISIIRELERQNIPYRNEQQFQDILTEPITILIIDYLLCLYGKKEPKSWNRLQKQLMPFIEDEELEVRNWNNFIKFLTTQTQAIENSNSEFSDWAKRIDNFLNQLGSETIVALSPEYQSKSKLNEVIEMTKTKISEMFEKEQDLINALKYLSDDQVIRILTIHKSKGLEFHSVIMLAIEKETFWGTPDEKRRVFFVGVSRAKQRLLITYSSHREKPPKYTKDWNVKRNKYSEFWEYFKDN